MTSRTRWSAMLFGMSLKFNVFSRRRSAHRQSAMITPERGESEEEHQTNETNEEAWNAVGKVEARITFINVPTKIGS